MSERNPILLLEDILLSVGKIINYTQGQSLDEFMADEKTIDAVIRNFEISEKQQTAYPMTLKTNSHLLTGSG